MLLSSLQCDWHRQSLESHPGRSSLWSGIAAGGLQGEEQPAEGQPNSVIFSAGSSGSILFGYCGNKIPASWDCYSLGLCLMCKVLEKKRPAFPCLLCLRDSKECNLVAKCTSFISCLQPTNLSHTLISGEVKVQGMRYLFSRALSINKLCCFRGGIFTKPGKHQALQRWFWVCWGGVVCILKCPTTGLCDSNCISASLFPPLPLLFFCCCLTVISQTDIFYLLERYFSS